VRKGIRIMNGSIRGFDMQCFGILDGIINPFLESIPVQVAYVIFDKLVNGDLPKVFKLGVEVAVL
jgi:hypothetical protein